MSQTTPEAGAARAAGPKVLRCTVVTPERALLDQQADFVALPMYDGELGVLPGRTPLIGRLGCGELRIRKGAETLRFFVDGGFAQVRGNQVTVLTARALKPSEINAEAARQVLASALEQAPTPEAQEKRFKDQERARAQLRLLARGGEGAATRG
jgi:F-type H+-transporting ATPase subunit epsilon